MQAGLFWVGAVSALMILITNAEPAVMSGVIRRNTLNQRYKKNAHGREQKSGDFFRGRTHGGWQIKQVKRDNK